MSATVRRAGLADAHFRWRDEPLHVLRREAAWYTALVMPLIIVLGMYVWLENAEYYDSLGRLLFMAVMALTAWTSYRLLHPTRGAVADYLRRHPKGMLARLRHAWVVLGCGLPLGSAALSALGYSYAAREIGGNRLSSTAAMILGLIFVQAMLVRWIFVEYRRLSVLKAREMQAAKAEAQAGAEQPGGESPAPKPDTDLDLVTINEQTRQLLRTFTLTAAVIGLYTVWSGIFPALRILDDVRLWGGESEQVTLLNLMLSAVLLFITVVAAKNLPGLLEVLVLQHLPTDAAGRYAISTLSRYAIVAGGLTSAFQAIGIGWDRVQWLVAAMGVGLGFGLQEIFANFVSGVIILFERPVRVGDVVTVGDVSGVVSQIRIRATTITTGDRLEYIIPNREFVTGSVLNWTLSDTVNRIVIKVGVAYGSDTERTRTLLESVCRDHSGVLADPAPLVTFEGFGESTLDFVVRAFIPDVNRRLVVTHELHSAINKALNDAGIEIAFPQRELRLREVSPLVAKVIHDVAQSVNREGKGHRDGSDGA
jgi:potassium efflux system protein